MRTAQTSKDITLVYKKALDRFAIQKWPINYLDIIRFPKSWKQQLTKAAVQIIMVEEICKKLLLICILKYSSLVR